jgi:chromosome partitioning protein
VGTILALANQKGGVGKTTTAVNLAACLAEAGGRTLVLDLDPQANATSGLGERANGTSSYDLLDGAPLEEIVHPTRFPNLDIVPSRPELAGAAVELTGHDEGESFLRSALSPARERYDYVFVVRKRLNPKLAVAGMLLTMVDGRTRLAADVAAEVRRHFGELVFDAVVPRSVRLAEAPSHGLPITAYDPASAGADAYFRVASELVDRA